MEGCRTWRKRILTALGSGLLIIAVANPVEAFFITGGAAPPVQQSTPPTVVVPPPVAPPVSPPTTPPTGPTGSGETGPSNVNPPTDPSTTPEPASLITALLGAGLTMGYGWRKRRRANHRP